MSSLSDLEEQRFKAAFDALDLDKSGFLSETEMLEGLKLCGMDSLSEDDRKTIMSQIDRDGDNKITFDEFKTIALPHYRELSQDENDLLQNPIFFMRSLISQALTKNAKVTRPLSSPFLGVRVYVRMYSMTSHAIFACIHSGLCPRLNLYLSISIYMYVCRPIHLSVSV